MADESLSKEAKESIQRGLKQKGTIYRGSFAKYVNVPNTETVETSEETKKMLDPQVDLTEAPEMDAWQQGFNEGLEEGEKKGRRDGVIMMYSICKKYLSIIDQAALELIKWAKNKLLGQINGK